jgi:hypothetical protein
VLLRTYPFLHQVLPRVEDLTPNQAIFYLEEKALTTPLSASFLGISVPRSMLPVTAGSVMGLLLVFSLSLRQINRLVKQKAEYTQSTVKNRDFRAGMSRSLRLSRARILNSRRLSHLMRRRKL